MDHSADNAYQHLTAAGLILDTDTHEVRRDGRKIALDLKEFRLLEFLLQNKNRVVSREEILRRVWDREVNNHTLDARMSALRTKVDRNFKSRLLYTITKKGYMLVDPALITF